MNDQTPRDEFEAAYAALSSAINEAIGRLSVAGPQHSEFKNRLIDASFACDMAWERLADAMDELPPPPGAEGGDSA